MKKLPLLLFALFIVSISTAQKIALKNVPQAIQTSFQNQFPKADDTKWEKEGLNFEAEFELDEIETSALYDPMGNLIETEVEIHLLELHSGILEFVEKNYAGQKIKEASKITKADGTYTYEAEIRGMDLIFDSNGVFVKEVRK